MRAKRNYSRWMWLFNQVFYHFGVAHITGGPEIGIEVEVEGKDLIRENPQYHWKVAHDGSLRVLEPDEQAIEYVFRKPLDRPTTKKALEYLEKKLADATIFESDRTSVHVHINASDLTVLDVYKWLTLYFIFEPTLQKYCGNARMGNHFALSSLDAESVITNMTDLLLQGNPPSTNNDLRYAACNYTALGKFGTLEFRAHEGTISAERIWQWVSILLAIKDKALTYGTPKDIVDDFSRRGPSDFAEMVFGRELFQILPFDGADLFEGARLIQDLAYGFGWDEAISVKKARAETPAETPAEAPAEAPGNRAEAIDWALARAAAQPPHPDGWGARPAFNLDEEDQ